jgi:hypothetical protein
VTPAEASDLRLQLIDNLTSGPYADIVCHLEQNAYITSIAAESLRTSRLWWMNSEAVELLEAVSPSFPDDFTLDSCSLPSERVSGIVVFERPKLALDAVGGGEMRVDAICWFPSTLTASGPGISLISFRYMEGIGLTWLGRADWPYDFAVSDRIGEDMYDSSQASVVEDRQVFGSMWALVDQRKVVSATEEPLERSARRRAARQNVDPNVTRVAIHDPNPTAASSGHAVGAREFRHRWVVSPFWRSQPYGPGNALRKPVLVGPYVKGPKDAPMLPPARAVWRIAPR